MRLVELHPILELALIRQSRGKLLHFVRTAAAGVGAVLLLAVVAQAGELPPTEMRAVGLRMFQAIGAILLLLILMVVPALTVGPFVRARETGILDALILTGSSERQIVRAFWGAAMGSVILLVTSLLPFLILAAMVGGVTTAMVLALMATAVLLAAVVAALALLLGVTASAPAVSAGAPLAFGLSTLLLSILAYTAGLVVLPATSVRALTAARLPVVVVLSAAAVGTLLLVKGAGRRLAVAARREPPGPAMHLAVAMAPSAFRTPIGEPARHRLDKLGPGPRRLAVAGTLAVLAVGATAGFRDALMTAVVVAVAAGAWLSAAATESLLGPSPARDLALAGRDPWKLKRLILAETLRGGWWPLSAVSMAALTLGFRESARSAVLALLVVAGLWVMGVTLALRLIISRNRFVASAPLAALLVVAGLVVSALLLTAVTSAGSSWRLAHPLTLLAHLCFRTRTYWEWAGPATLASVGWLLVGLHLNEMTNERLRGLFREPGAAP